MARSAVAIRHIHFEDVGTFAPVLADAGFDVRYCDVGGGGLEALDPAAPDLLVVLGGPVGVYEEDAYPFLRRERDMLRARLALGRPTLGICLGAQLIAAALGARVFSSDVKEIGFGPVSLAPGAEHGPLRHLDGVAVLHWHGDTFDLPEGATRLASTDLCRNQAFSRGPNVLGLQFHPEADAGRIEPWLIGHAAELAQAGIDPRRLRADAALAGTALREAGGAMLAEWLDSLRP